MGAPRLASLASALVLVVGLGVASAMSSLGATTVAPLALGATLSTASPPTAIAVDPSGARAFVTDPVQNTLYVFDLATRTATAWIPTGRQPDQVVLIGDRAYVSNFTDHSITEIDLAAGRATKTLEVGGLGLAADLATATLFAAAGSELIVLDALTDSRVATVAAPRGAILWGVAFDAVTQRLFVTDAASPRVLVYDASSLDLLTEIALDAPSRFAISAHDGQVFVASYSDRSPQLSVIDAASAKVSARRAAPVFASTLALDVSGTAYVTASADRSITAITSTTGTLSKATFDVVHIPGAAAVNPVSGAVIAATGGGATPPQRPLPDPVQVVRP